ncbi:MAG TPA: GIY-YIG nuclease family protein [Chthoniobacterales bacterium]|jgi:putative endonuclease
MRDGFVYIMASVTRTLYIGVTNSLVRRVWQHQHGEILGFTKRYELNRLVYFEYYGDIRDAIAREKQLKRWRRAKKNTLIESLNPNWDDLSPMLEQQPRLLARHPERSEAQSKDRVRGETPDPRSLDRLGMTAVVAGVEV